MNLRKRVFFLFGMLATLSGCSGSALLNFTIPRSGYTVHRDIAYGDEKQQKLDVYVPNVPAPGAPVVIFIHGGSWQTGNKNDYLFAGQALASRGFTAVVIDYRMYPEVYFPAFMEDAAKAFVWTHQHIGQYGGNPANLFLSGHSSGAHMAVLLTLDDEYLRKAHGKTAWIKGTMGISGPYDFLPFTDKNIIALFSTAPDAQTQPINYVRPGLPPILLMTGDDDSQVLPRNTIHLSDKLRSYDDPVTEKIYPGVGHIGIVLALARGFRGHAPTLNDMADFVRLNTTVPALKDKK